MTIFSPHTVGSVATRRSTERPSCVTERRPSCGLRFSAMSIDDMIFRREMMPSWIARSAFCISCSTPSMRNRTSQLPLARFDVDVARPVVDRLSDQQVHEPHDRCVVVLLLERLGHRGDLARLRRLLDRRRELAQLLVGAQEALEHLRQRVLRDDDGLDEQVGHARDVVERDDVGGVEDADRQPIAATIDRDQLEPAAQVARHQRDHARVERHVREVDVPVPGVQRDGLGDLRLGHHLGADQQLLELGPLAHLRDGRRHLRSANRTGEHKRLCESSHGDSPNPSAILGADCGPDVKSP